jgi:hypothetical protein
MEMDNIFNPFVFRKCLGWKDISGDYKFSKGHEDYFLIHPFEHLMPDMVPRKARCKSCEDEFKRYQTLIRVRRYRINRKQKEVLKEYVCAYQDSLSGKIALPPKILINLRKIIIENGGILEEKKKEATE